jgi:hypothetical protein
MRYGYARLELYRRRTAIARACDEARNLDPASFARALLVRHLCILVSGFLERSIDDALNNYAASNASPRFSRFVERRLGDHNNLNSEKILKILEDFDVFWRNHIEDFIDDERLEAINSIYGLRNSIAHGRDVSLSLGSMLRYADRVDEVIDEIFALLGCT